MTALLTFTGGCRVDVPPAEMLALASEAGFAEVQHVSAAALAERYFANRTDGLRPPTNSEELLVATT